MSNVKAPAFQTRSAQTPSQEIAWNILDAFLPLRGYLRVVGRVRMTNRRKIISDDSLQDASLDYSDFGFFQNICNNIV